MSFLRTQPILRQVLGAAAVLIVLLGVAMTWSALKARAERAAEVQTEAGTIATTAVTVLDEYLASLDAMALSLTRHPAVVSLDGPASTRLFISLLKEQPLLGNILLRSAGEKLLATALPAASPDVPAPPIVGQVIRTGRAQASQLLYGPITRRRTVFLAYPVKDARGQLIGVLGFSVLLPQLEALFSKLPLPQGSVVELADQNNLIMARSVESEKYIGSPMNVPSGASSSLELDADGIARVHGNATIARGPWLLSVAIPRAEVLRRLAPLWQRNLVVIAVSLFFVIGSSLWVSWQTAVDLKRLQVAAGKIAAGDLSPPKERTVSNLEMAELQASFVTMAAKLREARDTLDRQFAQERKMLEAVQSLQRQVVRQERLAAVGLLVSGIAHELNNPLQAILGMIEVLERHEGVGEEAIADIALIKAQSNRARDIIRNLSRFSRQQAGPPALIDLRDVISAVVQLRKRELDSAAIALDVETSSLRRVLAVFAELEQVLLNFVVNAQQAIEGAGRKSGRIQIRLVDVGRKIRLEVWDNGPGVPKDDERKLFQPFFTTKPVGTGTGLGLSVSYGIVDAYGGSTGYFNNEWGGATFFIELPAAGDAGETRKPDDGTAVLRGRISPGV